MKKDKDNQKILDSIDYLSTSASATECTGLIPSLPYADGELDSYEEIFHYQPPVLDKK